MDNIVRIVCMVLLLIIAYIIADNVKLLLESNQGKKISHKTQIKMNKPDISVDSLVKLSSFLVMINHGTDLCKIETEIENIPYYKGKNYFLVSRGEK